VAKRKYSPDEPKINIRHGEDGYYVESTGDREDVSNRRRGGILASFVAPLDRAAREALETEMIQFMQGAVGDSQVANSNKREHRHKGDRRVREFHGYPAIEID